MREIKFRAWFKVQGKMVYNLGFDNESFKSIHDDAADLPCVWDKDCITDDGESYDATLNFKLMQYTGLHDKHGKEIYEGDIVNALMDFGPGGMVPRTVCIVWSNLHGYYWNCLDVNSIEIIGNKFENLEILEDTNHD